MITSTRYFLIFLIGSLLMLSSSAIAGVSFLTLNLHGTHPTDERTRFVQARNGAISKTDSKLFYFTEAELARGHATQLQRLTHDFNALGPDLIFLQEVAGGSRTDPKDCSSFYSKNSAQRLTAALPRYALALACRGNIGWWTEPSTFKQNRIVTFPNNEPKAGAESIVFDFDSNPYPVGLFVEGLAILVRSPLRVTEEHQWRIRLPESGQTFFAQAVRVDLPDGRWILGVNVHAGWGLVHFEQAVQLRVKIFEYLQNASDPDHFAGAVFAGDFNASLFRPASSQPGTATTIPWEITKKDQFDLSTPGINQNRSFLRRWLMRKDTPSTPARSRAQVDSLINQFFGMLSLWREQRPRNHSLSLHEGVDSATEQNLCQPEHTYAGACTLMTPRLDYIFTEPSWRVAQGQILYSNNNWQTLEGLSDHPAVFVEFDF